MVTAVSDIPRGTLRSRQIGILANTFAIEGFSIMSVLFDYRKKSKHLYR